MNFNHSIIFIVIESANNISNIKKWICYITIRLKIISRKRRNMMFKKKKLGKLEKIKKEENISVEHVKLVICHILLYTSTLRINMKVKLQKELLEEKAAVLRNEEDLEE